MVLRQHARRIVDAGCRWRWCLRSLCGREGSTWSGVASRVDEPKTGARCRSRRNRRRHRHGRNHGKVRGGHWFQINIRQLGIWHERKSPCRCWRRSRSGICVVDASCGRRWCARSLCGCDGPTWREVASRADETEAGACCRRCRNRCQYRWFQINIRQLGIWHKRKSTCRCRRWSRSRCCVVDTGSDRV